MMRFQGFALAAAAMLASAPGSAAVITTGSYGAGDFVYDAGSLNLGPGRYRFTLDLTTPVVDQLSYIDKTTVTEFYCVDPDSGPGEFNCGGDDVPTYTDFTPVTPTRYQALVTVDPLQSVPTSGPFIVRYETYDTCCGYTVELFAGDAGSYTLSFAAVPEPGQWALMIVGMGLVGGRLRRRTEVRALA